MDNGASPDGDRAVVNGAASVSAVPAFVPSALDRAINLAVSAHKGQIDKGWQPYILHPLRVMLACKTADQRIAAVLHDTVEDGGVEINLIGHWFGQHIANAVDALSRRPRETYSAFIERCAGNDIARTVKLADLRDNMDISRLGREPTIEDARRQWKYGDAVNLLMTADFAAQGIEAGTATTGAGVAMRERDRWKLRKADRHG